MLNDASSKVFRWELAGAIFLIITGTLLHFTFEWSNRNAIVGVFSPVNESVWEHLKLGYTAMIVFSIIEYFFLRDIVNNYFAAKAAGILAIELIIVIPFYAYTAFTGHSILFIDISLFIIGCIVCQLISFKVLTMNKLSDSLNLLGLGVLMLLGFCFILFTFLPPRLHIFMDSGSGKYGIFNR